MATQQQQQQIKLTLESVPGQPRDTRLQSLLNTLAGYVNELFLGSQNVVTARIDYQASNANYWILVDASVAAVTVTLPLSANTTHQVGVVKIDASINAVTVLRTGGDSINGALSVALAAQYDKTVLVPDGATSWYIFS
jgi:hypothetical protein